MHPFVDELIPHKTRRWLPNLGMVATWVRSRFVDIIGRHDCQKRVRQGGALEGKHPDEEGEHDEKAATRRHTAAGTSTALARLATPATPPMAQHSEPLGGPWPAKGVGPVDVDLRICVSIFGPLCAASSARLGRRHIAHGVSVRVVRTSVLRGRSHTRAIFATPCVANLNPRRGLMSRGTQNSG